MCNIGKPQPDGDFNMKHFFEPYPGQLLYHYTSADSAEAIIRHHTLRLSEFSMMNDRSEYTYAKKLFIEAYHDRDVFIEELPRFLLSARLVTHEPETVMMIGCLTEERDDVGLWDRYASKEGCVVGIDGEWLVRHAGVKVRRISYDPEYMRDFVRAGLSMLQGHYETQPDDIEGLSEYAALMVMDLYAFKDPRFRSECEIRVSRLAVADATNPHGLADVVGHGEGGKTLPPLKVQRLNAPWGEKRFIDVPLHHLDTRSAIRTIGLGPGATSETRSAIEAACKGTGVEIWQSDVPLR